MKKIVKKALTLLSVNYAKMLEYRSELIFWVLAGSLPIIMMGIWIQAADSGKFAFKSVDFARYFFAVFLARQISVVWVIYDFEKEVLEGKLSPKLLQPIDPVWHHVANHLGERVARMPFVLFLSIFFFVLYPQAFWLPSITNLLLFILAAIMAFALRFIIQYTFAIFAFWTEKAAALENLWLLFFVFLSGLIAPLDVFPENVRNIVMWTPFPYMINFPASILVGLPVDLTRGFLSIAGWFLIFLGINRFLWRMGLKKYSGMGA
ncbi:ABC-2 family transporter protein [Dolichospermum sp. UHCC 0684]|jgi:ABC-2 type transport system permease protein|uniref:ABC transporter permease n=1 Tax=unclassified Dolichospermum TaxID=2622029 RepID=UPI00144794F0|nr:MULTISPECIES: ABC-2 family transporter protein [unclassified Dolichospermum]MEA5531175.1 ABC-2 family transporter protein [Dolichospermum sp. UHCC 0684]MTJ34463.1 multidrug ABC transporter permease [Dolichospermum sp. UHCC 0260]